MALNNTAIRVIVSAVTIPLILILCYLGGLFFLSFILAIGLVSFYEFSGLSQKKNSLVNIYVGLLSVFLIVVDSYFHLFDFKLIVIAISVILLLFELFRNNGSAIQNTGASLLGIFYIALFASTIVDLREFFIDDYLHGGYLIISILASIWICDSAAFFVGSAIGKHKMFPRVSPKKSWEGAVAGFVFAIITMVVAKYIVLDFLSIPDVLIIGLIIGSIGQIGDLVESLLKRDAGVKDSSNIIPGHGGIFDRFDSLLFSSPVIYMYLFYVYKV